MGFFEGFGRLVKVGHDGEVELRIGPAERELLATLLPQLRSLLVDEAGSAETGPTDPMLTRLFPSAHPDDPDEEGAYRALVHDDLLAVRLTNLDVVEQSLDAETLDAEQVGIWMRTVNELRLVLGTKLDVTEDDEPIAVDDDKALLYAAYSWLGVLLDDLIRASSSFPPEAPYHDT